MDTYPVKNIKKKVDEEEKFFGVYNNAMYTILVFLFGLMLGVIVTLKLTS